MEILLIDYPPEWPANYSRGLMISGRSEDVSTLQRTTAIKKVFEGRALAGNRGRKSSALEHQKTRYRDHQSCARRGKMQSFRRGFSRIPGTGAVRYERSNWHAECIVRRPPQSRCVSAPPQWIIGSRSAAQSESPSLIGYNASLPCTVFNRLPCRQPNLRLLHRRPIFCRSPSPR